jgi:L-lactate dehydrogenase complex protein LldE
MRRAVRVALLVTCVNDTLFPQTGIATVRLLERLGHEVVFPDGQTCCGQMHFNAGYQDEALALAARVVRIFADFEVVVVPSASCAGMVREFYGYLAARAGDRALARELEALPPRVRELSQFLVGLGTEDVGAVFPHRVAYHPTCHSLRLTRVGDAPLRLLRAVDRLELVELERADECCGFGGTFAVKNAETSTAMVADKADAVVASRAEFLTALDNSCLMNIGGLLARRGAPVRMLHLAEILAAGGAS